MTNRIKSNRIKPGTLNLYRILRDSGRDALRQFVNDEGNAGRIVTMDQSVPAALSAIRREYAELIRTNVITATSLVDAHLQLLAKDSDKSVTQNGKRLLSDFTHGQIVFEMLLQEAIIALEETNERSRLGLFTLDHCLRLDNQEFANVDKVHKAYSVGREGFHNPIVTVLQQVGGNIETARKNGLLPDDIFPKLAGP